MPLGWNTLDLTSFAMQHSKQFLARGPWRYHRLVSASDLHNSVDYSRTRHNLLRQHEHPSDFKGRSETANTRRWVAALGHGQRTGDRLAVEPLGVQWARAEESCPVLGIAQPLQRLVARGNEHGYGPGARVTGKGEEIKRMEVCQDPSAVGRNHPVLGAEKP